MKRKITAALLAMLILISLAGCGNQESKLPTEATDQTVSATAETETPPTDTVSDTEHTEKEISSTEQTAPAEQSTTEPSESETEPEETKPQTEQTQKPADTTGEETKPTETVIKETEAKTEETKPVETTPTQTETTDPPKTEETTPETETTEPVVTTPARPTAAEIEPLVAQYLNEYRASQGAINAQVLPGLTTVARFRAEQLITNFSHYSDPDACTFLQYGEFVDMTELGFDASYSYYQGYDAEACAKGNWTGTAEDIARRIADGFRNSSGHWRYLGSSEYTYMAVGLTYDTHTAKWYCCVCVSSKNYGG